MNDTPLLDRLEQQLAFEAVEHAGVDSLWAEVAAGTLTPKDAVARALELDPNQDPALLEEHARFFAPPSAAQRQHEIDVALEDRVESVRARARRHLGLLVATGAFALAAVIMLAVVPAVFPPEALPSYDVEIDPWNRMLGGEATQAPCSPIHCELDLVVELRPDSAVTRALELKAWARPSEGEAHELPIVPTIVEHGGFDIRQRVDALGLTKGDWTLTFVIGPAGDLPLAEPQDDPGRPDLAILRVPVCVMDE